MKKFKFNFYFTTILSFLLIVLISAYIYELSPAFSIALIGPIVFLQAVNTFIFLQFRKGILLEDHIYNVPILMGQIYIHKSDIKSMLVIKGGIERILDFSTITLQMKGGSKVKFTLPSNLVIKMGDYSILN